MTAFPRCSYQFIASQEHLKTSLKMRTFEILANTDLAFFFYSLVFPPEYQFLQPNGRMIRVADSSVHVADCETAASFLKAFGA